MVKVKLNITDERMLAVPEILKDAGAIKFSQEVWDAIDFLKQNVRNVKLGTQHFSAEYIRRTCDKFGINANWITGQESNFYKVLPVKQRQKIVNKTVNKQIVKAANSRKLKSRKSIGTRVLKNTG